MRRPGVTYVNSIFQRVGLLAAMVVVLAISGCTYTQLASSPPEYVEYEPEPEPLPYPEEFFELSGYGEWIDTSFGWVWRPGVGPGWQPYFHGNWEWTEWGWTWISYEPFGWAAYHYGFWHYEPVYGWIWIPGDSWFANRVTWLYYGDYVCWAPIPPPGYYIADPWDIHVDFVWVGVHVDHFVHSDIGRYRVRNLRGTVERTPQARILRQAPTVGHIEKRTKKAIRPVDVKLKQVKKGGKEYQRMILPPAEKKRIDRYKGRVGDRVVKPQPRPQRQKPGRQSQKPTETRKPPPKKKEQPEQKKRSTKPDSKKKKDKKSKKGKKD